MGVPLAIARELYPVRRQRPTTAGVVRNWRMPLVAGYDSAGTNTSDIANSSTNKTLPVLQVNASSSRTFGWSVGAIAAPGALLYYMLSLATGTPTVLFESSLASDGGGASDFVGGSWTTIPHTALVPTGQTNDFRGDVVVLPANAAAQKFRMTVSGSTQITQVYTAVFQLPANGVPDLWVLIGMSITYADMQPNFFRDYIRLIDPTRDPIVINLGQFGYKTSDMNSLAVAPLMLTNYPVGVLFGDPGPNDFGLASTTGRPWATDTTKSAIDNGMQSIYDNTRALAVPLFWSNADYINPAPAPAVNGTANPENGAAPYNYYQVGPKMKALDRLRNWSEEIDAPLSDFYSVPLSFLECGFITGDTTHPASEVLHDVWRRFDPIIRQTSGWPPGQTFVEDEIANARVHGVTTTFWKGRLLDMVNQLHPPSSSKALAARNKMKAQIAGLVTSGYSDPPGVTLPSQLSQPLSFWFDPAAIDFITPAATNGLLSSILDRTANGYTASCTGADATKTMHRPNGMNGYGHFRNGNSRLLLVDSSPAGLTTLFDAAGVPFFVGWIPRTFGAGAIGAHWTWMGGSAINMGAEPTVGPVGPLRIIVNNSTRGTESGQPTAGKPCLYILSYDGTAGGNHWSLYRDGTLVLSFVFAKPAFTSTLMGLMCRASGANKALMDLGDVFGGLGALAANDAAALTPYARKKYGVAA